jgi:hypothetical protein
MRTAISPRLAMRIFLNILLSRGRSANPRFYSRSPVV